MAEEGKECHGGKKCCFFKTVLFILLLLNTYFLAGIWKASGGYCVFSGKYYAMGKKGDGRWCPFMKMSSDMKEVTPPAQVAPGQ